MQRTVKTVPLYYKIFEYRGELRSLLLLVPESVIVRCLRAGF